MGSVSHGHSEGAGESHSLGRRSCAEAGDNEKGDQKNELTRSDETKIEIVRLETSHNPAPQPHPHCEAWWWYHQQFFKGETFQALLSVYPGQFPSTEERS